MKVSIFRKPSGTVPPVPPLSYPYSSPYLLSTFQWQSNVVRDERSGRVKDIHTIPLTLHLLPCYIPYILCHPISNSSTL